MTDSPAVEWCAYTYPDGTCCPLAPANHIKGRTTHDFVPLEMGGPVPRRRLVVLGRAIP
jgi:hypothetical protein